MLRTIAFRSGSIFRNSSQSRALVSRGGNLAIGHGQPADPNFVDSAVNQVAGEVRLDQLEPHELSRMRADREKQLDIRNFTLNFGPQHPVRYSLPIPERPPA